MILIVQVLMFVVVVCVKYHVPFQVVEAVEDRPAVVLEDRVVEVVAAHLAAVLVVQVVEVAGVHLQANVWWI